MMKIKVALLIVMSSLIYSTVSYGQAGILDTTFGIKGIVNTVVDSSSSGNVVFMQPNGKILIGGYVTNGNENFYSLARYNSNGSIDKSFAKGGIALENITYQSQAYCGALQKDGKILLAGPDSLGFSIMRFDTTGYLDTTFSHVGKERIKFGKYCYPFGLSVQADGRILISGNVYDTLGYYYGFMRLNADGTKDNSFGNKSYIYSNPDLKAVNNSANSIVELSNDKILIAGSTNHAFFISRYKANGTIDSTFAINGKDSIFVNKQTSSAFSIAIQPDDKILVTGKIGKDLALVRFKSNGKLDSTFGKNGIDTINIHNNGGTGYQVLLQKDNKILVCGTTNSFNMFITRFNPNGNLDSTFSVNGILVLNANFSRPNSIANNMVIQKDNKIVIVGTIYNSNFSSGNIVVLRILSGLVLGTIDFKSSIPINTLFVYPNPVQNQVTIEYSLIQKENLTIDIYDIQGNRVKSILNKGERAIGAYKDIIDLSTLLSGSYILSLSDGQQIVSIKIFKQK